MTASSYQDVDNSSSSQGSDPGDQLLELGAPRKLAILGLPWETSEDTLRLHFSQFGVVECAEVMKDRFSGKSRGFGFVTFMDPMSATRALGSEHVIDGRRCEAKVALPKTLLQGDAAPARTTRIFVARIPQTVTEAQFRSYFEQYGKLQDAYMPKDHSKQAYRGIGFVTFASPDSVEKVTACKHWLNGHEIAIDRATPKGDGASVGFVRLPPANQRRSFDNGAGIVGPGLTPVVNFHAQLQCQFPADSNGYAGVRPMPEERNLNDITQRLDATDLNHQAQLSPNALHMAGLANGDLDKAGLNRFPGVGSCSSAAMRTSNELMRLSQVNQQAADANVAALQNFAKAQAALQGLPQLSTTVGMVGIPGAMSQPVGPLGMLGLNELTAQVLGNTSMMSALGALGMQGAGSGAAGIPGTAPMPGPIPGGRKSLDSALHPLKARIDNPVIANARAGPRIFIGKLTKDTSESDVKDYFSRFGYVMDVYLPKSKDNKAEHRGFGFVTFETDAAIQRVVGAGTHRLKGSTIAIDIAMPKVEEDSALDVMSSAMSLGNGLAGIPQGFDTAAAAARQSFEAAAARNSFDAAAAAAAARHSFDAARHSFDTARQFNAMPMVMQ